MLQTASSTPKAREATVQAGKGPVGPGVVGSACVSASARMVAHFAGTLGQGSLRRDFLSAIARIQPIQVDFHPDEDAVALIYTPASEREEHAFRHVMVVDALPEGWSYSPDERAVVSERVADALMILREVDADLHECIRATVGSFLMAKLRGFDGGSISSLVGAIWLGLSAERPPLDYAEIILHEYVHQCLFLDDMVNGIFLDGEARMAEADGLVTTAILKIKRGYDKGFHSAYVAATLADFYARLGMTSQVCDLLAPAQTTVSELKPNQSRFLSEHGCRRLDELDRWIEDHAPR